MQEKHSELLVENGDKFIVSVNSTSNISNVTWSLEKQLLNLYLHKKYKSKGLNHLVEISEKLQSSRKTKRSPSFLDLYEKAKEESWEGFPDGNADKQSLSGVANASSSFSLQNEEKLGFSGLKKVPNKNRLLQSFTEQKFWTNSPYNTKYSNREVETIKWFILKNIINTNTRGVPNILPNITTDFDKSVEEQVKGNTTLLFKNKKESITLPKKYDFTAFFLNSKQIAFEAFKQLSFRTTHLNVLFTSIFYFIALSSALNRRENNSLLLLLQGKIPGYANLYQNSCWETFENLTSRYLVSKTAVGKSSEFTKTFSRTPQDKNSTYLPSSYINDVTLSKDQAIISIGSPWNKQVQKDFRAFILDTFCTKETSVSNKALSKTSLDTHKIKHCEAEAAVQKKYILAPWYKIDACVLSNDVVQATRQSIENQKLLGTAVEKAAFVNQSNEKLFSQIFSVKKPDGVEYLIPCYKSKEQIFLENDSIPSKCNSLNLGFLTSDLLSSGVAPATSETFPLSAVASEDHSKGVTKKKSTTRRTEETQFLAPEKHSDSYSYLNAFQGIMKQYFYLKGLLYLNLAETNSHDFLVDEKSYAAALRLAKISNWTAGKKGVKSIVKIEAEIEQDLSKKLLFYKNGLKPSALWMVDEENKPISIPNRISESKKPSWSALESKKNTASFYKKKDERTKKWQINWYTLKSNSNFITLFENVKNFSSLLSSQQSNSKQLLEPLEQDINQLFNSEYLECNSNCSESRKEKNLEDKIEKIESHFVRDSIFKLLFCSAFRENNWDTMRHVSGYKFPDLNSFSVISLFKQFTIPRIIISGCFSFYPVSTQFLSTQFSFLPFTTFSSILDQIVLRSRTTPNGFYLATSSEKLQNLRSFASHPSALQNEAKAEKLGLPELSVPSNRWKANKLDLGNASQLVNQVLLTPFRFNIPPALPICYFKNLIASSSFVPSSNDIVSSVGVVDQTALDYISSPTIKGSDLSDSAKLSESESKRDKLLGSILQDAGVANVRTQEKETETFKILYKAITLPELTQIKKIFEKLGIDYQNYLKQPKDSPFAILISPSVEDDEAIKSEANRKIDQDEKKLTPFQLLQNIRETEQPLENAKNLLPFSAKNVLAYQSVVTTNGTSNFTGSYGFCFLPSKSINFDIESNSFQPYDQSDKKTLSAQKTKRKDTDVTNFSNLPSSVVSKGISSNKVKASKFSEIFKASFFGKMSLLPKLLVAKEQKEIKEQLLSNSSKSTNSIIDTADLKGFYKEKSISTDIDKNLFLEKTVELEDQLPDLQLRAEKNVIDLLDSATIEVQNSKGAQHRTFKAILTSSLKKKKKSSGHITNFCSSAGQKRKITSTMFSAPSEQHVIIPQINAKDWKKIVEWQVKTYFFDEQKRLQSLRESNPEKHFKMKKLTLYLPWVTFRTSLRTSFEWPLTRLDFTEFVPLRLISNTFFVPNTVHHPKYMIAAKKVTLSLHKSYNWWENNFKLSTFDKFSKDKNLLDSSFQSKNQISQKISEYPKTGSRREKVVTKQYLFEAATNHSYLLLYRLLLLFLLKNVFYYVYRISLKQFLIKLAYSDFGLTVTSLEFREWLQNSTPKAVYKVEKPLQSIAGIEQNLSTISQIIWHLRNFGRTRQNIPAVLVLGPATTEKTNLVQAIASEAKVAIVVQPLDALLSNNISPYEKLEEVFLLARKQAPCILFLDSLDRIGKSRKNVVSNYTGAEDSLFCLDAEIAEGKHDFATLIHSLQTNLLVNKADLSTSSFDRLSFNLRSGHSRGGGYVDDALSDISGLDQADDSQSNQKGAASPLALYQEKTEFESLRINLLLRLLTEIDGISPRQGVLVMATSQQSAMLDPALLRPGRFQTMIKLSLPEKATRMQLLKTESQKLGSSPFIPWEYIATRTSNMSGADILSAINHSAIRAILENTVHTVESLEHGLNCALALPKNKNFTLTSSKTSHDPFQTSRLAFYQAGKVVVQNLLVEYPNDAFFSLDSLLLNTEQKSNQVTSDLVQQDLKLVCHETAKNETKKAVKVFNLKALSRQQSSLRFADKTTTLQSQASDSTPREKQNSSPNRDRSKSTTFFATTKAHFQTRLVALYAGKAAELLQLTCSSDLAKSNSLYVDPLVTISYDHPKKGAVDKTDSISKVVETKSDKNFLGKKSVLRPTLVTEYNGQFMLKNWQSNLAFSDVLTASSVIHTMIDRWYLYSQKLLPFKSNQAITSLNYEQMQEQHHFVLFHKLTKQISSERAKVGFWSNSKDKNNEIFEIDDLSAVKETRQERQKISWWNEKICQEIEMFERPYGKWYRLYLPKIEQRERNEEWVPPDFIFHDFSPLSNIAKDQSTYLKTLHDLYLFERDSAYYNVVMNCFYKAVSLLSQNREVVDFIADHLIRFKKLRSPEISAICSLYLH